ncbi:MAG: mechanosensitive ion channel family protein [Chloroflexota bacterium]
MMIEFIWVTAVNWLIEHGPRILIIILIGLLLRIALKKFIPSIVSRGIISAKGESKSEINQRTETLVRVLMGAGRVLILVTVMFMVLSEAGIPIAPILAGLGVAGIAVGFGAQYLIRDLIAGVFIILENQYRVGDVAKVAGVAGLVVSVSLRTTVLRDLDGLVHHIPNGEISVASNFTRQWSRANLNIRVAYKEDLDRVMAIFKTIWEEMAQDPKWGQDIISKTPSFLRVEDFGDSGITIKVAGETKPIKQWDIMGEFRRRVKKTFDEQGIEIPWPHTKVYFGNALIRDDDNHQPPA